jgi:hypothetical protein
MNKMLLNFDFKNVYSHNPAVLLTKNKGLIPRLSYVSVKAELHQTRDEA